MTILNELWIQFSNDRNIEKQFQSNIIYFGIFINLEATSTTHNHLMFFNEFRRKF